MRDPARAIRGYKQQIIAAAAPSITAFPSRVRALYERAAIKAREIYKRDEGGAAGERAPGAGGSFHM